MGEGETNRFKESSGFTAEEEGPAYQKNYGTWYGIRCKAGYRLNLSKSFYVQVYTIDGKGA